ncbi:MAG: response regulator transcription factor [Anaerolineaceae bacterium]|nr:response regulator transcription factor [Anaerolineaceae bacterium]
MDLDELSSNPRSKVLLIDDEYDTVQLLKAILRMAGFDVISAMNGAEALKKLASYQPDLILLDLMMPTMGGWETFDYIRQMSSVPVIVISALGEKEKIVEGLQKGVDDYIGKPFYNEEVIARIDAVLRRTGKTQQVNRLVFPKIDLTIDLSTQEVLLNGQSIYLTSKVFSLLAILARSAPSVVTYEAIATAVWGKDSEKARKHTKFLIYLLRHKFDEATPGQELIINVDRLGYKLQTE